LELYQREEIIRETAKWIVIVWYYEGRIKGRIIALFFILIMGVVFDLNRVPSQQLLTKSAISVITMY